MTSGRLSAMDCAVYFNSHAHVERDMNVYDYFDSVLISTHTLTWSVTTIDIVKEKNKPKFQLTRSRGA